MSEQNGHQDDWNVDDQERSNRVNTELDLYQRVSQPSTDDQFLQENNLGLGNYSDSERWQQVQAFREHMFSEASFGSTVADWAIYETEWQLGEEFVEERERDPVELARENELIDDDEIVGRRHAIIELGRARFDQLGEETISRKEWSAMSPAEREQHTATAQLQAIERIAGDSTGFLTPHSRMISARHETSRSVNAHLIDNLMGRVRERYERRDSGTPPSSQESGGIGGLNL